MLELSDDAVREIKDLVDDGGLRFEGREGADGSWEFDPSIADEPADGDQVVERDGARVFLDPAASEALADQVIGVHAHGDHFHFAFDDQAG